MAAGAGGSLESTLERRFQGVSNTMDSIQGLATWCIDNKKYHSSIVRHWMKCLRKSDTSHRLNLFYVANDVIQNCKRKNAIVYRTAFAEMLPDAFLLVNNEGDSKVIKSVERILTIWEERGVYSGTLITDLRSSLVKEESPPETPVEQKTPVESKADLTSKIVAEFVPQALFDELSKYKKSLEELDLREKQLAAMRVDICSSDALKRLKDKAGGKKFSKDFEEGSAQLQEFVKFFDKQMKTGPPLMEALSNADIFYEMQYKEVKIVANAYQTFANRVSHLKRKLDSLKTNLPDMDDSPIPSPSADAPSPTGSESPFHGLDLAGPDPDIDGCAMDDEAEPPAPSPLSSPGGSPKHAETLGQNDNREVEDMDLSEEEMDSSGIIVEEQIERHTYPKVSTSKMEPSVATRQPVARVTPPVKAPVVAFVAATAAAPVKAPAKAPIAFPVKAPIVAPVKAPIAFPVKAPIVAPVKAPIAFPVKAPIVAPVKAPIAFRLKASLVAPVKTPVKAPVAAPVKAPVKATVASPVKAPVAAPVKATVASPVKATVASLVKTPVAGPVKAPVVVPVAAPVAAPVKASVAAPVKAPVAAPVKAPLAAPLKAPLAAPVTAPVKAPSAAVESVDLAKIGSILSSLNSVMKNTGPLVESPPAAAAPAGFSLRTTPAASLASHDASSLVHLLSKVDVSRTDLLGALSKVKGQGSREGITTRLSSPAANVSSDSSSTGKIPPSSTSTSAAPSQSASLSSVAPMPSSHSSTIRHSTSSKAPPQISNPASTLVQALHRDMDLITEKEPSPSSASLESKIHNFLQGNPAFNAFGMSLPTNPAPGGDNLSPVTGTDTQGGTPVRDEGGGTPTQDEIMDKHMVVPFTSNTNQSSIGETVKTAPVAYQDSSQQNRNNPQHHLQPGAAQNGQVYQSYPYGQRKMPEHAITAPVAHYQQISAQTGGPVPGERAPGSASSAQTIENFHGVRERGWYGDTYPEGIPQQPRGYNVTAPGGAGENKTSGLYPYQTEKFQEPQVSQHGATTSPGFLRGALPPVPKFPPPPRVFDAPPRVFDVPPHVFDAPPPATSSMMMPPGQQPSAGTGEAIGPRVDSVMSGMVVHDHQHKSMFHPDDSSYDHDQPHPPHPEDFHPHPDDRMHYQDEVHHRDARFFQDDSYHHPDDQYYRQGSSAQHYPRVQGRLTPPQSPSEDPYYAHDYRRHSPPPPHYTPRRPLPPQPHFEMRHPGPRPPHRPPHPAQHPHPRGPPRAPFPRFQGPDPGLRGKRPGPRGGGHPGPMFPPKRPFPPPRY